MEFKSMKRSIVILFLFTFNTSFGQTILGHDYKDDPYEFSQKIMDDLKKDTMPDKYSYAATELSFINNYKQALALNNIERTHYKKLGKADSLYFLRFKPKDARAYILEQARKSQIVIINEAHQQPLHRIFHESILGDLYKIGYRYLGMETLNTNTDTALNKRKYPIINTGGYSRQPQYGNLIRTALQDGFYVFGYEADFAKNLNMSPREREIEQAKNIKALLDTNPCAKILIHCGYGHLIETEIKGWEKAMAGRLKEYTGIDPFTISQTGLTEMGDTAYESHIFRMLDLNYDAAFLDSIGNPLNGPKGQNQFDVAVYHPRSKWVHGRPGFYFQNNRQPVFVNDQITVSFPCLVLAYYASEDISVAVPTDVIELQNKEDKIALALAPGEYVITVKDMQGKVQKVNLKH